MNKQEIEKQLEETHKRFIALVNAIPEESYSLPTENPAWTVGDVLFHITLGPRALALEVWMLVYMRGLFGFVMRNFPSRFFNSANAWFGRQNRISRRRVLKAYGRAHTAILSVLRRMREEDLVKSVVYPPDFVSNLAGEVTPERLFLYVTGHFEEHAKQLETVSSKDSQSQILV